MDKPTPDSSLETACRYFLKTDFHYTESWIGESTTWARNGVYKVIGKHIDLAPGDNHIDLGSGLGQLIIQLKKDNPKAHISGVEKNSSLVVAAAGLAEAADPPLQVRVAHCEYYLREDDKCISRVYYPPENPESLSANDYIRVQNQHLLDNYAASENRIIRPESKVDIVIDDIRTMELLSRILGDKKIESGSFTFPGASISVTHEHPYEFDIISEEEQIARINTVMKETRQAAYRFMSERIKPGKFFVVAERIQIPHPEMSTDELITSGSKCLGDSFGEYTKYWKINKGSAIRSKEDQKPESGLLWVNAANGDVKNEGGIIIWKLQRNDVSFTHQK